MKRRPAKMKTLVSAMTDPEPSFVSLVDHGAIQRPFHAVKAHRPTQETEGMPKQPEFKIHRVVFDPAHFTTEKSVEDYLVSKNYTDFTVQKSDSGAYFVEDTPKGEFPDGALRMVPHSSTKGVTYIAGEIPAADDADDTAQKADDGSAPVADGEAPAEASTGADAPAPGAQAAKSEDDTSSEGDNPGEGGDGQAPDTAPAVAKAAPRVRTRWGLTVKGASMNALIAGHEGLHATATAKDAATKSFAEMLENYNGSTPPGIYDMADALMGSLRKMFHDGDVDESRVRKLADDFAGGVLALYDVYEQMLTAKSEDGTPDEAATALMALLFDAIMEDASKGADSERQETRDEIRELKGSIAALTATVEALTQADDDAAQDEPAAAAKSTERTLQARRSTDEDHLLAEAVSAQKAVDEETQRRTARRTFGQYAASQMTKH